ncbi:hypothetical protein TNCV_3790771 [Trichonephila clavipes]|nr:hypothetical protein TNCV_3790771 [Trichonephila clavipes]
MDFIILNLGQVERMIPELGTHSLNFHAPQSTNLRFQLCPDDHPRRVWRRLRQRADPAFTIARHTDFQPGVMVWGAISFEAGSLWLSLEAHLQPKGASTTF